MSTTLTAKLNLIIAHAYRNDLDMSDPLDDMRLDLTKEFTDGDGDGEADCVWHDTRSLVGTSENIDLAGGVTNVFGTALTLAYVKALVIRNQTATAAADLTVGAAAANAFASWLANASDALVIKPGGLLVLVAPNAGYAVTADTGDILKINAGAATITYDIYLLGVKA